MANRSRAWNGFSFMVTLCLLQLASGLGSLTQPSAAPNPDAPLPIAGLRRVSAVDFAREILPFLESNCLACHNQTKAKANLVLETPQTILKGGESGPAVAPGRSGESLLLAVASHQQEPLMPPKDNPVNARALAPEQLGLLKLWIDQGAKGSGPGERRIAWQPLPERIHSILAVALSSDGQFAACGRGNQLLVYQISSRRLLARLTDPRLFEGEHDATGGAAHLDLVHVVAFSPDGELLASGGYREVKLWRRRRGSPRFNLAAAFAPVARAIGASANGRWFATGGLDGTIQIWNPDDGSAMKTLIGHNAPVRSLTFTTDGARLFSAANDQEVRVWDLASGQTVVASQLDFDVVAVAWLPSCRLVAAGSTDGRIRLWELPESRGEPAVARELRGHDGAVTALAAVAGDRDRLVSGGTDGTVRLWNLESGELIHKLDHGELVKAVAASADSQRIAGAGAAKGVTLWDGRSGQLVAELRGDRDANLSVLSAQRALAYATSQVVFWRGAIESNTMERDAQIERVRKAAEANLAAERRRTEQEQALVEAESAESEARKALAEATAQIQRITAEHEAAETASQAAFAELRAALKRVDQMEEAAIDQTLEIANLRARAAGVARANLDRLKPQAEQSRKQAEEHLKTAQQALKTAEAASVRTKLAQSTSENELLLAITSAQRAADALTASQIALQAGEAEHLQRETVLALARKTTDVQSQIVRSIAFSPDNLLLASSGDDGKIHTWSAESGLALDVLPRDAVPIEGMVFAGPHRVLSLSSDGTAAVWELDSEWQLERAIGTGDENSPLVDRVTALQFTPDGKRLITGGGVPSRNGELKIWEVADGRLVQDFADVHSDVVFGIDVTPDGRYLASGGADKFVRILDLSSNQILRSLEGHLHFVQGVSWKRDGRTLVSAGADPVIKVWDAFSGERKKNIEIFSKEVTAIAFLGDTDQVIACSGDGTVQLFKENGDKVRRFEGATDFMNAVAASYDGNVIVAGGNDGWLRVWNGQNGEGFATFDGAPRGVQKAFP